MESNGTEGRVTVSDKTRELLEKYVQNKFIFKAYKDVFLPNFNETIKAYQILNFQL